MGNTRDFLKQVTSGAHRELDASGLVKGLAENTLSPEAYAGMLQTYHAFYSKWEKQMRERYPHIVSQLGDFRFGKSEWLREDLDRLAPPAAIARFPEVTMPEDIAGLAGCLYVIEGSTIGGMHLSRGGREFPAGAGRFFQGYGDQTMTAWKSFIDWLETHATTDHEQKRAAETAAQVFAWFQQAFSEIDDEEVTAQ